MEKIDRAMSAVSLTAVYKLLFWADNALLSEVYWKTYRACSKYRYQRLRNIVNDLRKFSKFQMMLFKNQIFKFGNDCVQFLISRSLRVVGT